MNDLLVGYVILAIAATGLFLLTSRLTRSLSPRDCNLGAVIVVGLLLAYIRTLWYDVRIAELLPFSNLIVLGNWLPLFAAVLAGFVWRQTRRAVVRRTYTTGLLATAGSLAALFPLLGSAPECGQQWDKLGTCLQTT